MDYLNKSLKLPSDQILPLAPHIDAAKMIDGSILSTNKTLLIKDLTTDSIPENIKVIYIDEIAAIPNTELISLANTLYEINDKRAEKFRVIVFGDPAQTAPQEGGMTRAVESSINEVTTTTGLIHMELSDPLTQRFRSPLDVINDLLDIYDGNEKEVRDITVYASVPVEYQGIGVHAGTQQQLKDAIEINKGNGRSKAIAVRGPKEKQKYMDDLKGTPYEGNIFTYDEIAGIERDEVYVDLSLDQFRDAKEFNKAYYTAAGRGKQYIFLNDKPGTLKNQEKGTLQQDYKVFLDEQTKGFDSIKDEFKKRIEFEKAVMKGVKPVVRTKESVETQDEVINTGSVDSNGIERDVDENYAGSFTTDDTGSTEEDSNDNVDQVGNPLRDDGIHRLKFPSYIGALFNKVFKNEKERAKPTHRLEVDSDVIYVKTQNPIEKGSFAIHVLGVLYGPDNKIIEGRYAHLGIIGNEELENDFGAKLVDNATTIAIDENGKDLFNKVDIDETSNIATLLYDKNNPILRDKTILMRGKLNHAVPLTYVYNENKTLSGKGMFEKIFDKFSEKFLDRAKTQPTYSVVIYGIHDVPQNKYPGIPYLLINAKTGKGENRFKQQSIRLNPVKLGKNNDIIVKGKEFYNSLIKLENYVSGKLSDVKFNNMIELFAKNYHIVNNQVEYNTETISWDEYKDNPNVLKLKKEQFTNLKEYIDPIIKDIYGVGKVKTQVTDEAQMILDFKLNKDLMDDESRYEFIPFKKKNNKGEEVIYDYGYVYKYDKRDPNDKGSYVYKDGLRLGSGIIQKKLNILAKANEFVNGQPIRVVHRKSRSETGEKMSKAVYTSSAKSIMDTSENTYSYYKHIKDILKANNKTISYNVISKDGTVTAKEDRFVDETNISYVEDKLIELNLLTRDEIEDLKVKHTVKPISSVLIGEIVNFDGERHSNLRTPLPMLHINEIGEDVEENIDELESLLETNFEDIIPTNIGVKVNESLKSHKVVQKKKSTRELLKEGGEKVFKSLKDRKKNTGDDNIDKNIFTKPDEPKTLSDKEPLKGAVLKSQDSLRKMIRKMIPGITDKEIEFVTKEEVDRLGKSSSWGVFVDGIIYLSRDPETGKTYDKIARHEVFHKIYKEFLTPEQRQEVDDMAWDEFDDSHRYNSTEELLAVKFHEWRNGTLENISDYFKSLFQKFLKLIGLYDNHIKDLDDLFFKIEYGLMDKKNARGDNTIRQFKDIRNKYGDVNTYLQSRNFLLTKLKKYRLQGINEIPSTRREIIEQIKADIDLTIPLRLEEYDRTKDLKLQIQIKMLTLTRDNIDELIKDLFPGFNSYEGGVFKANLDEDTLQEIEDTQASENLNKHIIDNDKWNVELDVTDEVKEFLSYIESNNTFLSWRYAFLKMISMFEGLNFDQENIFEQIVESFNTKKINDRERAIFKHLKDLHNIISENLVEGTVLSDKIKFIDEHTFIYSNESVDNIKHKTDPLIESGKVQYILQNKNESSEAFMDRIALAMVDRNIYYEEILLHKKKIYAIQTWNRLVSSFNSLRQRNPKIGERKSSFGGYEIRYFNARGSAVINGIRTGIESAITNKFETKDDVYKFLKFVLPDMQTKYATDDVALVKAFLTYIDLSDYAVSLTDYKSKELVRDIKEFFATALESIDTPSEGMETLKASDAGQDNDINNTSDTITIGDIMRLEGGSFLNRLTDSVSLLDDLSRILSSNDANGERRYNAVVTSQAHKNIFQLIRTMFDKKDKTATKLQHREIYDSPFFSNNIFIKQINQIFKLIDHDGVQYETWNGTEGSIMYTREKRTDFNFRTFVLGFLGNIKSSSANSPHYTQFIYPNERTTAFGVEIKVLKRDKLLKGIEATIRQIGSRDAELSKSLKNYDPAKLIGFEVLGKVLGSRTVIENNRKAKSGEIRILDLALEIYKKLDEDSRTLTGIIVRDRTPLDSSLPKMTKIDKFVDTEIYGTMRSVKQLPVNKGGYLKLNETNEEYKLRTGNDASKLKESGEEKLYKITEEQLQPYVSLFYINNYVNGYHFNQLVAGDTAGYINSDDLVKRLSIAFAPGKTGYVHKKYGMNPKSRVAVVTDPTGTIQDIEKFLNTLLTPEQVKRVLPLYEKSGYKPADGQGFATPERFDDINYGFGENFGNVLKPVYDNTDSNGVKRSLKYSSVKLSDDLIKNNSALAMILAKMRKANIDELVFATTMKSGLPVVQNNWYDLTDSTKDIEIDEASVFEIDNRDFRIQLDPAAKLDSQVSNPTQLSYLLRLYGTNTVLANDTYNSLSRIISHNFTRLLEWMGNKEFSTILKKFADKPGQEDLVELLNDGINFNFPSVTDRVLTNFLSSMSKKTGKIKYPGSKLILQTAVGIQKKFEDTGKDIPDILKRELKIKVDDNGGLYSETVLPRGFLHKTVEREIEKALKEGRDPGYLFYYKGKPSKDAFGFRIPSSELHSGVVLKVVGFYDSYGTNIIVAPKETILIHGADFDIDSLFVIKRKYIPKYNKDNDIDEDVPIGYDKRVNLSGNIFYTFNENYSFINEIDDPRLRREVNEAYHVNRITENLISISSDPINRERMLSPISFKYLEDEAGRMKDMTDEDYSNKELSDIVAAQEVHSSLTSGEMAIGMFMNALKGFAFLHQAYKNKKGKISEITKLKPEREVKGQMVPLDIKFNGNHYNEMRDTVADEFEDAGSTAGYRFDSLGNAALDNLKKLILPYLNLGMETIKAYSILVMHGVGTKTINNFISQPILKHFTKYGYYKSNNVIKKIESILSSVEKSEDIDITDERMISTLKEYNVEDIVTMLNKKSDDITEEERSFLAFQLKIHQQYDTLDYLGKKISDMAKMTNVIRTSPNTVAEIEDIISFAKSLAGHSDTDKRKSETSENYIKRTLGTPNDDKSSFPYFVNNFFNANPHIYESLKTLHWSVDKTNKEFVTYSEQFRRVATKIYSEIGLKLDKTKDLTEKKIRDEFVKFIMSSLVDRSVIKPIKWRTKDRRLVVLNGIPAFNERFCQMVAAAKTHDTQKKVASLNDKVKYEGNPFLQSLNVIPDAKTKMNKIVFHGPSRMDISDLNLFRESFESLNSIDVDQVGDNFKGKDITPVKEFTDFQRMFVTYAMINYGMHFGLRNYSTILPGVIYKNVSDNLVLKFNDIKNYNKKELNNIIDAFEIQLVQNYPDSLWYDKVDIDAKVNGERKVMENKKEKVYKIYSGVDEKGNYYDRYYESDGEREWPKYHVEKFGDKVTVYRIQNVEYTGSKYIGNKAYYVKVGMKNRNPIYDIHSLSDAQDYNVNDAFNTKIHHINGFVSPTNIYESEFHSFKEGDVLSISGFSDPGKMYPITYRVKKVVGSTVQFEPIASPKSKAMYDKPNGLVQDLYNKLEKELIGDKKTFHRFNGKIIVNKHSLPVARPLYQKINKERFSGLNVLAERQTGSGLEVYINGELLSQWAYGRQLEIYSKGYDVYPINGINETIKKNPELTDIGTKEQYLEYIKTIFPKSNIKDVLVHFSKHKFTSFDKSKIGSELDKPAPFSTNRFFFAPLDLKKEVYDWWIDKKGLKNEYYIVADLSNNIIHNNKREYDNVIRFVNHDIKNYDNNKPLTSDLIYVDGILNEIAITDVKYIHILGSKQDIEGFKSYVSKLKKKSYEGDMVFNKKEVIETILSEYDEQMKEILHSQFTRVSKAEFNELAKSAGFNSIGNHWVIGTVANIEKRIINEIDSIAKSSDFTSLRDMTDTIENDHEDAINELKSTYDNKTVSQILDEIESRTTSEFHKLIIRWMRPLLLKLNPQFAGGDYNLKTKFAQFTEVGIMEMDYAKLAQKGKDIKATDRIILHELMHGLTIIQFSKDSKFKTELERRMQLLLVANPALKTRFSQAFKNSEEFMSEIFTNEELYNILNTYKFPDTKKNIIREIYDWIMSWFGKSSDIRTGEELQKFIKSGIKPMRYSTIEEVINRGTITKGMSELYNKQQVIELILFGLDDEVKDSVRKDFLSMDKDEFNNMALSAGLNNIGRYWTSDTLNDMQSRGYDSPELDKIVDQGLKYQVARDDKGNEQDWYIGPDGKIMRRITDKKKGFFSFFTKKGDNRTSGERKADREWSFTDKTIPKIVDKKEETYDEYKERMDKASIELFVRGRILHALDRRVVDRIQNGGNNESAINSELMRIAYQDVEITDSLDKKYTIKISLDPSSFDWYENNIQTIYKNHGINIFDDIPSDLKDVLVSEVIVGLDELGFAGTIDKLIRHHNGRYSIKDMATGVSFDEATTYRVLSYGDQNRQLMDSARDLKKLQMMIYAIMLKANNKGMQFDDLSVMWIPNSYNATSYDGLRRVEVDDFMRMIESFFKDKKALKEAGIREDIHDVLLEKDPEIFNPSEYSQEFIEEREGLRGAEKSINDNLITKLQVSNETPAVIAERLINELTKIIGTVPVITKLGKNKFEDLNYTDQIKAKRLVHQVMQLLQDPATSLAINPELDVSFVTRWIGNYSAMPLPQVQIWKKFRDTQAMKASLSHQHIMNGFQALNKKVLDDFYKQNPVLNRRYLNNANYKALYGWGYKEFDNNGAKQERLITRDDKEYESLTVNQQNMLNYMNDVYASYFKGKDAYVNQKAITITEFGVTKDITVLEMFNRGIEESHRFKFIDGWFPKIPKEQSEMIYESGKGSYIAGLLNKDFWKAEMHNSMTYYQENKFEGRTHNLMVLPLKFMGSVGIDSRKDYSYNLEFQFDRFTKSIEYKKNMDPVYGLGESLRGVLEQTTQDGQPIYTNTAEMFADKLTSDVLGRTVRQNYTRKPLKFFGSQWEDRELRTDAMLMLAKNWVSATTMWLKPFTGGGNGINALMLQHKDSLKGTIANKLFGIKEDAIDYTLADSLFADGVFFTEHIGNAIMGKIQQDKTWLLLKKLDYLPDNFDFKSAERYMLSTRNRVISQSSMYVFHRVPEEMVSMVTMIAQLKHLKHPTLKGSNGKPLSIWDCYSVEQDINGVYDVVWKYKDSDGSLKDSGSRGILKTGKGEFATYTPIKEITAQESAKLKRIYERMQGGYRKEEAAALETYVLGKMFIQLKKYSPQLLMNAFKSKQNEMDLGMLKATSERRDGETVYEWIGRINEARFRILGKFMLSLIMFNGGNRDYKWNNMTDEMKQHVIDAGLTLSIWFTAYVGYLKMFGDDKDTDTMKKWWKMYVMDNFIQQYSPNELLKILNQGLQPVALTRALKTVGATTTMMAATWGLVTENHDLAFTQDEEFRGWNEFRKSIPFMASYTDLAKRLGNLDDKLFVSEQFSKWR
jgi:hypothetical protein